MGFGGGLGDALAGTFRNDVFGTSALSRSAQNVAEQQWQMANDYSTDINKTAKDSADRANLIAASPDQLATLTQNLGYAQKQAASDQRLLDAIDPAIMEASKQALSILQGGQSATTSAMSNQLQRRRQQLVNSLREQYGPGAENSAMGQKMLRDFDLQSDTQLAQTNQNSLAQLFGMGTTRVNGAGISNVNAASGALQNFNQQRIGTEFMGLGSILDAKNRGYAARSGTAGAGETANIMNSSAQQSFWNNWSNSSMAFGEAFGGFGMGSGKKSQKDDGGSNFSFGGGGGGGGGWGGSSGGFQLANSGSTNQNFWGSNPYKN